VSERLRQLAQRIRVELVELENVVRRIETGWERVQRSHDDYYLDGVALNIHGFYSGLERTFELIAAYVDGTKPTGENWHQALLQQMTKEHPGIRPAVISETTLALLDEYRGFRHVVRNVYTFKFDPSKIKNLVINISPSFKQVQTELLAFADFLDQQASSH
jgi:hypothetical protein